MLIFLLFLNTIMCSCLQQDSPSKTTTKNPDNVSPTEVSVISSKIINENLNNYSLGDASEDVGSFGGNVYSIKKYLSDDNAKKTVNDRTIDGKTLHLQHFTIYRKDGRRSYRKEISGEGSSIKKYYYDEPSGNLILKEDNYERKYGKSQYSKWIFYNKNQIISEEVGIEKNKTKTFLNKYIRYKAEDSAMQKRIIISEIGDDSISSPDRIYTFNGKNLIKKSPSSQYQIQKLSLWNGIYKPYEADGYRVGERKFYYKYDKKWHLISETWYNKDGLENKNEFSYNEDYTESIELHYDHLGTEISTRTYNKYDTYGNLIFEQYKDRGSIGSIDQYEYRYDKEGNWIVKKKFYSEVKDGIIKEKKLITIETREMEYYTENTQQQTYNLPEMPSIIDDIRTSLPKIAKRKDAYLNEKKRAVENDAYDAEITVKEANDIKDFTPKYWELKAAVYGNLDDNEADEAVAVYEMPNIDHGDAEQVLAIFKKENTKWKLRHQTSAPLLSSGSGGMMGNPFNGISISKKSIVINHFGGSRGKWQYTHRFRFQNGDWYLIGASTRFGASCDYSVQFDYNISTGDATYKKTTESCENGDVKVIQSQTNKKTNPKKMNSFTPGDNVFKFPNVKEEIYY